MINIGQIKKNVPLFLISGILVLCVGFFIVSCGSGISPQEKVENPNRGPYAVDFSDCPAQADAPCFVVIESDVFEIDSTKFMAGKELTAEAWVKIHSTSTTGAIFGRMDSSGIFLYVESGTPKAVVRRVIGGSGSTTSTVDLIVSASSSLVPDIWTHLAGVLSFPPSATSTLDLYVDGQRDTTSGAAVASTLYTEPGGKIMKAGTWDDGPAVTGVDKTSALDGAVDEARLWGVARTQPEILACMDEELGLDSGTCGRITDDLIGYWRFNGGSGNNVSGDAGLGGAFKKYTDEHWNTGWTAGAPIAAKD